MASPIVLSSDDSDDDGDIIVVGETKAAPKDTDPDGDVVFLSIEKPKVDGTEPLNLTCSPSNKDINGDQQDADKENVDKDRQKSKAESRAEISTEVNGDFGKQGEGRAILNKDRSISGKLTEGNNNSNANGGVDLVKWSLSTTTDVQCMVNNTDGQADCHPDNIKKTSSSLLYDTNQSVPMVTNGITGATRQTIESNVSAVPGSSSSNPDVSSNDVVFHPLLPTRPSIVQSLTDLNHADSTQGVSVKNNLPFSRSQSFSGQSPVSKSDHQCMSLNVTLRMDSMPAADYGSSLSTCKNVPPRKRLKSDNHLSMSGKNSASTWSTRCAVCSEEGRKVSCCMQGHQTCCLCLEERVKTVLCDQMGKTLKCLIHSCDSFYPMSELKHTLPPIVVEILEAQLEKHYVDYLADMMMKDMDEKVRGSEPVDTVTLVQRADSLDLPNSWVEMDPNTPFALVKVEPGTETYTEVSLSFHETMSFPSLDIETIYRVQNPILWKFYCVKKQQMILDHEGERVEEKLLFHGTSDDAMEAICKSGFDWRLCGKHGTMYGQGSYFAKEASYSHQYSLTAKKNRGHKPAASMRQRISRTKSCKRSKKQQYILPIQAGSFPVSSCSSAATSLAASSSIVSSVNSSVPPMANSQYSTALIYGQLSRLLNTTSGMGQQLQTTTVNPGWQSPLNLSLSRTCSGATMSSNSSLSVSASPHLDPSLTSVLNTTPVTQQSAFNFLPSVGIPPPPVPVLASLLHVPQTTAPLSLVGPQPSTSSLSPDADPPLKMFLARVLVGKYTTGNNGLRKPPPLSSQTAPLGKCYDSCVDNIENPKIFVVFDSAQAYPEFIVHYRRTDE